MNIGDAYVDKRNGERVKIMQTEVSINIDGKTIHGVYYYPETPPPAPLPPYKYCLLSYFERFFVKEQKEEANGSEDEE